MPTEVYFVFDTNVMVSALLLKHSVSRQAFDKASQEGQIIIGVYRSRTNLRNDKSTYRYFWEASYTIDRFGKTKIIRSEKFFIDEYGEKEAKRLAIEFREMWEEAALQGVEAVKGFFAAYREGRL